MGTKTPFLLTCPENEMKIREIPKNGLRVLIESLFPKLDAPLRIYFENRMKIGELKMLLQNKNLDGKLCKMCFEHLINSLTQMIILILSAKR